MNIILNSCVSEIKHDNYGEKKLLSHKSFLIINYLIISATMIKSMKVGS